jgi:hypothetical protein
MQEVKMANNDNHIGPAALLRLALMAALVLPWFFSCPPPRPSTVAPPPPPLPEEQPSPAPEIPAQPEETAPAPLEEEIAPEPEAGLPTEYESMRSLVVPGDEPWIDLGLDVEEGQKIFFLASGVLSLQKGNPTAVCGPDGYKLRTVQQPMPEQNIGALIGKVVKLLSVETDPETGKEIRQERIEYFFVGSRGQVTIPGPGRLYLGINEQVVGDNQGAFDVTLYLLKSI